MTATRGMLCRSLLMSLQAAAPETHHQVDNRVGLLVADLDQHRAAGREIRGAEIDDLPDVAEAVLAGHQRQRRLVFAHFGREVLVLAIRSRTADWPG